MSSPADHKPLDKPPKTPPMPVPSASVLVISPTNQVLLLHRVRTASAFSSAHVFPGGAISPEHDGPIPNITDTNPNQPAYRLAAIRETFEESGILLAKKNGKLFTDIGDAEREEGRKAVHAGTTLFADLLSKWGCEPDVEGLIPFTRWITPPNVKKRFSTQMYIYFLPLGSTLPGNSKSQASGDAARLDDVEAADIVIPHPTHDGGIEHTAARFLPPNKWINLANQNRIILFPPQYFLAWHLAPFLAPTVTSPSSPSPSIAELQAERDRLTAFLQSEAGDEFSKAIISPVALGKGDYGEDKQDGVGGVTKDTAVLRLDYPGPELDKAGVKGTMTKWVVTTKFKKEGPRDVRVVERGRILGKDGKASRL
ncbi:uncharacterized protein CC84DRAFT_1169964 [Paraphaeosphaeria sporulosa]|uniref:Nudix hydrolase domain-containing protein n=1 Tax=Paraphaeosphaeria sporulosa TaxID=1460663 RepID=A0A177BWV6_9PLEO|nr:uncharacterized protein CC84DRAFT_1169964 [Paraphaeosphaeria sporulosa]OAF98846.1 hypothetical protein CC84DRAFT_1169964 [Paraphaeosphaeria sporulosa]